MYLPIYYGQEKYEKVGQLGNVWTYPQNQRKIYCVSPVVAIQFQQSDSCELNILFR